MIRTIALKVLRAVSFPMTIRHHWMKDYKLHLHSFRHKNYWWHGKKRETREMRLIQALVRPGDQVLEAGGHIGYLSLWFRHLIGDNGRLVVFEPGTENRSYLSRNVRPFSNVTVEAMAVADVDGTLTFYEEDLSGQNNSLVEDFRVLQENSVNAGIRPNRAAVSIPATTLDTYVRIHNLRPSFVKIDVEGAEVRAVQGMQEILEKHRPVLMIEVTTSIPEVHALVSKWNYKGVDPFFKPIEETPRHEEMIYYFPEEMMERLEKARKIIGTAVS